MELDNTKRQSIKVVVSEAIMVVSVIITVVVLALLVSGYWLNSNFEVERNGMLQISSSPTGATVTIDGVASSWMERTNSSKILSSGEHDVLLSKEGYDTWTKTINITEGLLYRLHYPRLFLQERDKESVVDISNYTSATISPDRNTLLLMNETTKWATIQLDVDAPSLKPLDISQAFSSTSLAENTDKGLFTGQILDMNWDYDSAHVLIKSTNGDQVEWVLLDVRDVSKSINLSKEFGNSFSRVEIIDNNASTLLAIQKGDLHKIDVPGRSLSAVIVDDIIDFDHFNNEVVYSASLPTESETASEEDKYYIGHFRIGDNKPERLETTPLPAKVAIGRFYDEKFIATVQNESVALHNLDDYQEDVKTYSLSFTPERVHVGHKGDYVLFNRDQTIATLDLEIATMREWTIEPHFGWLDNDMLYAVQDGDLIVYDFDGLNRRMIAHNVSSHYPISIVEDKWLYYCSDGTLMRESLLPR